ncbi:MAG: rhodanese-like domain-containing protein, partial [Maioricimonas sp. JB045]
MKPLSLGEVLNRMEGGNQVVDVRDAADFEGGHLKGAVNVGLRGKYATWAGTVLNHDDPIIVIAEQGEEEEAIMRLGRIGFDGVAGYLDGGMSAVEVRPDLIEQTDRITAAALNDMLGTDEEPVVLDVRSEKEWAAGHIEGSMNIPLSQLGDRIDEVPTERQVVVHCEGGYRSAIACSLLQKHGIGDNAMDLVGGFKAWSASRLPVQSESGKAVGA